MAAAAQPTQPSSAQAEVISVEDVAAAFPQLQVLELIGQGGMGSVFKVRQPKLDRLAALKLLPRSLAGDPAFAGRFEREARLLARLNHPNIVAVYDYGQAGDFFYLLMEFVDGVNLRQAMHAGRFEPRQALAIVPRICEALQFAHDEGVLHRDVKPENILLDTKGRVKLVDFGIAKLAAEADQHHLNPLPADAALTQAGTALGTPSYMAPEQLKDPSDVDQRADIYSLGVVFYELLTGELPAASFIPPSQKSGADPRVDTIVQQALQKERERRQYSASQLRTQVETVAGMAPAAPPQAAADAKRLLANIAASFWAIGGIIAVIGWLMATPNPPQLAVWGVLASAVIAVALAIPARFTRPGKATLIGVGFYIPIWLAMVLFSARHVRSPAAPAVSTDFHCLVFEENAESVDRLIPNAARRGATSPPDRFESVSAHESRSAGGLTVYNREAAVTDSQVAEVSGETLQSLLQEMATDPGLLVNQSRNILSDCWDPGAADSWSFSRSGLVLAGGGGGGANLGFRQEKGQDQIHISCQVNDNIDIVATGPGDSLNVISTLFYEGIRPKSDTLAFLVPFSRKGESARYLVVVYQFGKEVDVAANVPVALTTALATRGDLKVYLRSLGQVAPPNTAAPATGPAEKENAVVLFAIPEDDVQAVVRKMDAKQPLPVDVYDHDFKNRLADGALVGVDNQITPQTGTLQCKAEVEPIGDALLYPNMFVNVRMLMQVKRNALLAPAAAVQSGSNGQFVYVVEPDRTASTRAVQIGATDDAMVEITAGLSPGDRIVLDGFASLHNGSRVRWNSTHGDK